MHDAVRVSHEGAVSTVTLAHPPFNLLDIAVIDALVEAHQAADAHPDTRVMVTRSGLEGMFSNGLNPLYVLERDEAGRVDVFRAVGRLCLEVYRLSKPHIAAVNGPAMAGGAVLAVLADFRVFEQERGRICFAEAKVGLPVPAPLMALVGNVCGPRWLREVVMMGRNFDAAGALDAGLADVTAPAAGFEAAVEQQCGRIARLSPDVLRAMKRDLRAAVVADLERLAAAGPEGHELAGFVGGAYLGEGLQALMEGRPPVFVK